MAGQPFTVAILSDIHGNYAALEAVLSDLKKQSYDLLVLAGDLVMNGPRPAETLACIRSLDAVALIGETDRAVADARTENALACWTSRQIDADGVAYLNSLPFSHRVAPPGDASPEAELLVVHATPADGGAFLVLEPNSRDARCAARTSEAAALGLVGATRSRMIIHGHLHYASSGWVGEHLLVSIGSVGFPFDGNQAAAYALATWDGRNWNVVHRRVAYDVDQVIADLAQSGQPLAETMIQRLRTAAWCPQLA